MTQHPISQVYELAFFHLDDLDGDGRAEILVTAPGTGRGRVFGFVD